MAELNSYRNNLPKIPHRMRRLPVERGYPVPWFVAQVAGPNGGPLVYDFRVQSGTKRILAIREKRCWLCGGTLGNYLVFVIGPMCAINRTSSEPPSHKECAEFAVRACPFLNLQEADRRANNLPAEGQYLEGGLRRNPGVALLWTTRTFKRFAVGAGADEYLIRMGDPLALSFWREGRPATRAEVMASIDSGYPQLLEVAVLQGPRALAALEAARLEALALLPAAYGVTVGL